MNRPALCAATFRGANHDYPVADRLVWTYGRIIIDTTAATLTVDDNGRTFAIAAGPIVVERA